MSKLDCEWGEGLRFMDAERQAFNVLRNNAGNEWTWLSNEKASRTDYFVAKNNQLKTLIEIKSRDTYSRNKEKIPFTWDALQKEFGGEYLISKDKIDDNITISRILNIPFFLVINFMREDFLVRFQITNKRGEMIIPFRQDSRVTQATSNGGTKTDLVYMIQTDNKYTSKIKK